MKIYKTSESEIMGSFYKNLNKKSSIRKVAIPLGAAKDISPALKSWFLEATTKSFGGRGSNVGAAIDLLDQVSAGSRQFNNAGELLAALRTASHGLDDAHLAAGLRNVIRDSANPGYAEALGLLAEIGKNNDVAWSPEVLNAITGLTPQAKLNLFNEVANFKNNFFKSAGDDVIRAFIDGINPGERINILTDLSNSSDAQLVQNAIEYLKTADDNVIKQVLTSNPNLPALRRMVGDDVLTRFQQAGGSLGEVLPAARSATRQGVEEALAGKSVLQNMFRSANDSIDDATRSINDAKTKIAPLLEKLKAGESLVQEEIDILRNFKSEDIISNATNAQNVLRNLDSSLGPSELQRSLRLTDEYRYVGQAADQAIREARGLQSSLNSLTRGLTAGVAPNQVLKNTATTAAAHLRDMPTPETGVIRQVLNRALSLYDSTSTDNIAGKVGNYFNSSVLKDLTQKSLQLSRVATQLSLNPKFLATSVLGGGTVSLYSYLDKFYRNFTNGRSLIDLSSVEKIKVSEDAALSHLKAISFRNGDRETIRTDLIQAIETSLASISPGISAIQKIENSQELTEAEESAIDTMMQDIQSLNEKLLAYNRRIFTIDGADALSIADLTNQSMLQEYEAAKTANKTLANDIMALFAEFSENLDFLKNILPANIIDRLEKAIAEGNVEEVTNVINEVTNNQSEPPDDASTEVVREETPDRTDTRTRVDSGDEDRPSGSEERRMEERPPRRRASPGERDALADQIRGRPGQGGRSGAWTDGMYLFDTLFDISRMPPRLKKNLISFLRGVASTPEGLAYIDPSFGTGRFGGNYMKAVESLYRSGAQSRREIIDLIKDEAGTYGGGSRRDISRAVKKYKDRLKYYRDNQDFWASQINDDIEDYLADRAELESLSAEASFDFSKSKKQDIIKNSSYDILSSYLEEIKRL